MSLLTELTTYDHVIFRWVNDTASSGLLDVLMPFMRGSKNWIPCYVALVVYVLYRYRWQGLRWVVSCLATVGLADALSSHVIKPIVQRARPCHEVSEITEVILRVSCGPGYSFASSHATNHTALAMFIICSAVTWGWGQWRWLVLAWALMIGYAQVYVGVHYPFDVLCGSLLGGLLGVVGSLAYLRWLHLLGGRVPRV